MGVTQALLSGVFLSASLYFVRGGGADAPNRLTDSASLFRLGVRSGVGTGAASARWVRPKASPHRPLLCIISVYGCNDPHRVHFEYAHCSCSYANGFVTASSLLITTLTVVT